MKKKMKKYNVMCYVTTQYYTEVEVLGTDKEDVKEKIESYVDENNFRICDTEYFDTPCVYFKDVDETSVIDSDERCYMDSKYDFEVCSVEDMGEEVELEFDEDLDDDDLIDDEEDY